MNHLDGKNPTSIVIIISTEYITPTPTIYYSYHFNNFSQMFYKKKKEKKKKQTPKNNI